MSPAQNGESLIHDLIRRARERPFEARRVTGHVFECHTRTDSDGTKVFAVYIRNGSLCEMFWLADCPQDTGFRAPRLGDRIKGVVNTFGEVIDFADFRLEPIFDFENCTAENEDDHFAWFREQERLAREGAPGVSPVYIKNWKP